MPIIYESVPNEPKIYFSRAINPFDPTVDSQSALEQLTKLLESTTDKLYIISDVRELNASFSDVVIGMAEAAANPDSPLRNDRVVIVTLATGALQKMVVDWLKQSQYGAIQQLLFETEEEAVAHMRQLRDQAAS